MDNIDPISQGKGVLIFLDFYFSCQFGKHIKHDQTLILTECAFNNIIMQQSYFWTKQVICSSKRHGGGCIKLHKMVTKYEYLEFAVK